MDPAETICLCEMALKSIGAPQCMNLLSLLYMDSESNGKCRKLICWFSICDSSHLSVQLAVLWGTARESAKENGCVPKEPFMHEQRKLELGFLISFHHCTTWTDKASWSRCTHYIPGRILQLTDANLLEIPSPRLVRLSSTRARAFLALALAW